jgi:hypothetical protein
MEKKGKNEKMKSKKPALGIGAGLIGIGLGSLLMYEYVLELSYSYVIFLYAFMLVLGGLAIFTRVTTQLYQSESRCGENEFQILGQEVHFFVLEFTKVLSAVLLAFHYPLEALGLWVILDCLDGITLPHRVRSLTLRHKIDKFTDFLCQVAFYAAACRMWSDLFLYLTAFFLLSVVKTVGYVSTGNRNVLIYIPNVFLFFNLFALALSYFLPSWFAFIFGNFYHIIIFTALMLIVSATYELIYNGIFLRFRYQQRRSYERWY